MRVFYSQALPKLFVYINLVPNVPFTHSSLTRIQSKLVFRSPLVLTSAITCPLFPDQATGLTGARQLVPSRSIAQQRTNSLLPTATMAIFLRDFLPPLIR